jgi:hypothetical protein
MFSELCKFITAVFRKLLFSGPTLILLLQPPVVPLTSDLLSAAVKGGGRGGEEVIRETDRVPTDFIFSQYRV